MAPLKQESIVFNSLLRMASKTCFAEFLRDTLSYKGEVFAIFWNFKVFKCAIYLK